MTKHFISRKIVVYDGIGFSVVVLLLWLDELIDIPHFLLGATSTPVNVTESVVESIIVIALALTVITMTLNLLKQIKYLEGLLPVCSFCKKIRTGDQWHSIVDYVTDHTEATFTHSCCQACAEKYYGVIVKNNLKRVDGVNIAERPPARNRASSGRSI